MARKVNKKFVIVLSAAVFSACTGYGVLRVVNHMRNTNPVVLKARAETAEKSGDLKTAAGNYYLAAAATAKKHLPGADDLYVHAAELCMQVSENAKTDEDAVQYYQQALMAYDQAQQENPRNKAAADTILELQYQRALYQLSWSDLERQASKQIATLDGAKPRAYRALARLNLLLSAQNATRTGSFDGARDDIEAALKFDPNYGMAVALKAQYRWQMTLFSEIIAKHAQNANLYRAVVAAHRGGSEPQPATAPASQPGTMAAVATTSDSDVVERALWEKYYQAVTDARAILVDYIAQHGINSEVANVLAGIDQDQFVRLHVPNKDMAKEMESRQKELSPTVEVLEKALAADPSSTRLLDTLDRFYRYLGQAEKSEAVYKHYVQLKPDGPEAYYLLARFYKSRQELPKAIEWYKESLKHQQASSGLDAIRNRDFQTGAIEAIASSNLDLAESLVNSSAGRSPTSRKSDEELKSDTEKVTAYVKECREYTDKLRSSHAPKGWIDLLDGRRELVNRNLKDAMTTLRLAAANLNGLDNPRLRKAKLYLADANMLVVPAQLGAAVSLIREALQVKEVNQEMSVGNQALRVRLGTLLNQSAKYDESKAEMEDLLGKERSGTFQFEDQIQDPAVRDNAMRTWAVAATNLSGSNVQLVQDAQAVLRRLSALPQDRGATLQLALTELASDEPGNMEAAANDAMLLINRQDGTPAADILMAYRVALTAYVTLGDREKAKDLADQALAKFPDDAQIKYLKEQASSPDGTVSRDVQKQIIEAIPDEYTRQSQLAYFYQGGKDPDKAEKEIAALQAAEKAVENSLSPDSRDKQMSVIDRIFVSAANYARDPKTDPSKRDQYWAIASDYVSKAMKLNLDGVDGKLYQGRLQLFQSDYQKGLALVEQAVAQREDYAFGHLVLGQARFQQRDWNGALSEFRTVIRLSPNSIPALQGAVDILMKHKGDDASRKEARNYLDMGLHLAPYNPIFAEFADELGDNLDSAIATRERNRQRFPSDQNNIVRLAVLYASKMEREADLSAKTAAINKAIDLMQKQHEKTPDHLGTVDLLARLLMSRSKLEIKDAKDAEVRLADVASALKLYVPFVNDPDEAKRLEALLYRGDFVQKMPALSAEWASFLMKQGLIRQPSGIDEAVQTYTDAIALEKGSDDRAERHLGDMYFDLGSGDLLVPSSRKVAMTQAEAVYLKAVAKNKDNDIKDGVVRRLIETQLRLGKLAEADKNLEDFLSRHATDVQALILKGYASIQQKKLEPAMTALNEALRISPNDPDALYYRADAELKLKDDVDSAIRDLQAARTRDTSVNSRLRLAQIYRGIQQYGQAAVYYQEVEDMRPDLYSARVEYAEFLYRLAVLQTKLPSNSNEDFVRTIRELDPANKLLVQLNDAKARFPGNLRWWLMYADLEKVRNNTREAQAYYEALYKVQASLPQQEPEIIDAYLVSLLDNKEYQKTLDLVSQILTANPNFIANNPKFVVLYLRRAAALQALNKMPEAVAELDRALAFSVDYAMNKVGEDGKKLNDLGPFVVTLNEAARIFRPRDVIAARLRARLAANPNELVSQIGLIQTLNLLGQSDEALKVADAISLPTGEDDNALRGQALRQMGLARYQAKKYKPALTDFTELLKIYPDDVDTLNNLAFMLADAMGQPKEAITYIKRALDVMRMPAEDEPISATATMANLYDTLGWAQYKDALSSNAADRPKLLDDAEKSLRKAINTQPLPAAYLHLALLYVDKKELGLAATTVAEGVNMAKLLEDDSLGELRKLSDKIDELRSR